MISLRLYAAAAAFAFAAAPDTRAADAPAAPQTQSYEGTKIMKWKDGKKAVFMLAFDDSCPTHLAKAIPELEKRKIVGNFFVVTGNGLWTGHRAKWEQAARSPYVELQNHTFTHKGVQSVEELEQELQKCNDEIYAVTPGRKRPRIIGFGQPGGVPWKITKEELRDTLAKYNLANRPPFYGPPMHYKSAEEMVAAVDAALAKGEMGHMDFHGVGGDWLSTPFEWFTALLDKLEAERDQLWIADTVSWHKYATERKSAEIRVVESGERAIRLRLSCTADPVFYDMPLTLATKVPAGWTECVVTQGTNKAKATAAGGEVRYDALPGADEITIEPVARN